MIIGKNAILGGGFVGTADIPENMFAPGAPAKVIKKNTNITRSKKHQILVEIIRDYHGYANEFLGIKNKLTETKKDTRIRFDEASIVFFKDFSGIKKDDIVLGFTIPKTIKD